MWTIAPTVLAVVASHQEKFTPSGANYTIAFGIIFAFAFVAHIIAAKLLAGEKATFFRVLAACIIQTLFGVILLVASFTILLLSGFTLPLVGLAGFVLLGFLMAGVYGFGFGKGMFYNVLTAAISCGMAFTAGTVLQMPQVHNVLNAIVEKGKGSDPSKETAPTDPKPALRFATEEEARTAALKKHPALGVAGSEFNRKFLGVHARFKTENPELLTVPDWPMVIADEVAREPGVK